MTKNTLYLFSIFTLASNLLLAQVGINTVTPNATLDIVASNQAAPANTDGVLIPRIDAFPAINPGVAQDGMITFLTTTSGLSQRGFYYWDNPTTAWLPFEGEWMDSVNGSAIGTIIARQAFVSGNIVSITDDGFIGVGLDDPQSEVHIQSDKVGAIGANVELTIENTADEVELEMKPGLPGTSFSFVTHNDGVSGMSIQNANTDVMRIDNNGEIYITDFEVANNPTVTYPALVVSDPAGKIYLDPTVRAPIDIFTVDDVPSSEIISTLLDDTEVTTAALYTFTITPATNVLIEVSYYLDWIISQVDDPLDGPDANHTTGLVGSYLEISGVKYAMNSTPYSGGKDESFLGSYNLSGHSYIPLTVGPTYTITLHGFIHSPLDNKQGWRVTFGGNAGARNRIQILERY